MREREKVMKENRTQSGNNKEAKLVSLQFPEWPSSNEDVVLLG